MIKCFVVGENSKKLIENSPFSLKSDKKVICEYKGIPVIYSEEVGKDDIIALYSEQQGIDNDYIYMNYDGKFVKE